MTTDDEARKQTTGRILDRLPIGDHVGMLLEPGSGQVLQPGSELLTLNDVGDLEAAHEV